MRALVLVAVVALITAGGVRASRAHVLPDLSVDQLTRRAAVVVEGVVTGVRAEWDAGRTQIFTTVTLRVAQYHKGDLGSQTIDLRLLGGTVDETTMAVIGQPGFEPTERVFLFLQPNFERRNVPFVGGEEGKLRISANAAGAQVLLGPHQTFERDDVVVEIRRIMRPIGQ